jgi:DNA-binding CsgD family transcriptional regulator
MSTGSGWYPGAIEAGLWERIDAAAGGLARICDIVLIPGGGLDPEVVVVVVERTGLPRDDTLCSRFGLTRRESQIALLLAEKCRDREIARRLGITVHTVRRHCENVRRKLGIHARDQVRGVLQNSRSPASRPWMRTAA